MKYFQNDEEYLRDFFEHSPVGFHAFGPDQKIIDMNRTELEMLGYSKEEIVGKKSWADLIIRTEIPRFQQHWRDIHIKGEVRNLNYTVVCKDGRRRNVLLNASARFDSVGKLINTRGSVVDITERYQMARALALSRQKLSRPKSALEKNNLIWLDQMDQWDDERRRLRENIQKNIEETIFPLIEKMKKRGSSVDRRSLGMLEDALEELTGGFALQLMDQKWRLSVREIEVCKMLRNGLKTQDIADLLSTSVRTVEHHRNHIRKKLGISKSDVDLAVYLKTFSVSR